MGAAGIRRHAGEIDAAFVFHLLEFEGARRTSALHDRCRALRESWPQTQGCLLDLSGRARGEGTNSGISKCIKIQAAGGRQRADYHGWTRNWHCSVPRVFAGEESGWSK